MVIETTFYPWLNLQIIKPKTVILATYCYSSIVNITPERFSKK